MSSMNNSQDDAQYQSSESEKLNRQKNSNSAYESSQQSESQISNEQKNQLNQHSEHNSNQQSQKVSSIKSISDKLNEPLLAQQAQSGVSGLTHGNKPSDAQDIAHDDALRQKEDAYLEAQRLGLSHPNFDNKKLKDALDPNRPLTDIPEPAPRYKEALNVLLTLELEGGKEVKVALLEAKSESLAPDSKQTSFESASMWALIASPELASHLELLQIGGLINLPAQFFEPVPNKPVESENKISEIDSSTSAESTTQEAPKDTTSAESNDEALSDIKQPSQLLSPLVDMTLLDMSDIHQACVAYPNLTRYGFKQSQSVIQTSTGATTAEELSSAMPEMINDMFAPNWELILYPERFDNGVDSLTTDVLACSVAVHILKQCATRKTPNRNITAQQICQHMRSYVLSQCNINPHFEAQYRQIRLFVGHVIVAAHYLGLKITQAAEHNGSSTVNAKGEPSANLGEPIYLNISSRSALLTRYPNISDYYINGWS